VKTTEKEAFPIGDVSSETILVVVLMGTEK
jgi:hypothetical protein